MESVSSGARVTHPPLAGLPEPKSSRRSPACTYAGCFLPNDASRFHAKACQVLAATPQVFPAARQRGLETEADGVVSISREPGTGVFAKACSTAHHRSSHATCCRPATNSTAAAAVTTRRASRGAAFRTQSVRMQLIPRKLLISRCSLRDSTPYSSLERLETPTFTVGHGAGLQLDFSPS